MLRLRRFAAFGTAMLVGCGPTVAEVTPPDGTGPGGGEEGGITNRYTGPGRVLWLVDTLREGRVVAVGDLEVREGRRWIGTVPVEGDVLDIRCMDDAAYVLGEGFVQRIPLAEGGGASWVTQTDGVVQDLTRVDGRLWLAIRGEASYLAVSPEDGSFEIEMNSELVRAGVAMSGFYADGEDTLALFSDGRLEKRDASFVLTETLEAEPIIGDRVIGLDRSAPVGFVQDGQLYVVDQADDARVLAVDTQTGAVEPLALDGEYANAALGADAASLWLAGRSDEDRLVEGVTWRAEAERGGFEMQGGERGDWISNFGLAVDAEGMVWTPLSYSPPETFGSAIGRFDPSNGALRERWTTPWSQSDAVGGGPSIIEACTPTP